MNTNYAIRENNKPFSSRIIIINDENKVKKEKFENANYIQNRKYFKK